MPAMSWFLVSGIQESPFERGGFLRPLKAANGSDLNFSPVSQVQLGNQGKTLLRGAGLRAMCLSFSWDLGPRLPLS